MVLVPFGELNEMNEIDIRNFICDKFLGGDRQFPLDRDTKLLDEGICDSLGMVQMVTEFERRCPGVKIVDQEVTRENFGSIAAIVIFLQGKQS